MGASAVLFSNLGHERQRHLPGTRRTVYVALQTLNPLQLEPRRGTAAGGFGGLALSLAAGPPQRGLVAEQSPSCETARAAHAGAAY